LVLFVDKGDITNLFDGLILTNSVAKRVRNVRVLFLLLGLLFFIDRYVYHTREVH